MLGSPPLHTVGQRVADVHECNQFILKRLRGNDKLCAYIYLYPSDCDRIFTVAFVRIHHMNCIGTIFQNGYNTCLRCESIQSTPLILCCRVIDSSISYIYLVCTQYTVSAKLNLYRCRINQFISPIIYTIIIVCNFYGVDASRQFFYIFSLSSVAPVIPVGWCSLYYCYINTSVIIAKALGIGKQTVYLQR